MRWQLLIFLLWAAYATPEGKSTNNGEVIFKKNCKSCHGMDGTKGSFKAANLQTSKITDSEIKSIIKIGRGKMKSYKDKLSDVEIEEVTEYVKGLRK